MKRSVIMLRMCSVTSQLRAKVKLAAWCSLAMVTTIIATRFFRAMLGHLLSIKSGGAWFISASMIAAVVGLIWFVLVLACGMLGARGTTVGGGDSEELTDNKHAQSWGFIGGLTIAVIMSFILAISAWLALGFNDSMYYSRELPWVGPLIRLQELGFRTAARLFPCRYEGFDTGCEAYKWAPTFLLSNAAAYLPFVMASVFLYRRSERVRSVTRWLLDRFLRGGALTGVVLLCLRLLLYLLSPVVSSPISSWGAGRITWIVLDGASGSISVAVALSIPFYIYWVVRALWNRDHVQAHLIGLTWLVAFVLAALELGSQFPR